MNAEPPDMRVEGRKVRRSADVGDPWTDGDTSRDLGDHVIRNAQQHQLGRRVRSPAVGDAQPTLHQAGADGTAGPAGADDVN